MVSLPSPAICAPMRRRHWARSTISGSRAALRITVVPRASVAAISTFSVAPTETKGKSTTAPFSPVGRGRVDVAVAQVEGGAERLEAAQVQVDRARADGAAAGQRHHRVAVAREHRPEHQDRGAHLAHDVVVGAVVGDRLGADDQHAAACCRLATSQPSDCSSAVMVRMSESRGALVSVTGSSVSSAAGISVRQAFLAPEIGIEPISRWPPCTRMLSMPCRYPCLSLPPPPSRARFCALRRARFARSASASRRSFAGFGGLRRLRRLAPVRHRRLSSAAVAAGPERPAVARARAELPLKIAPGPTKERPRRCRSSGVEHSLGKGEVQSSNLCGSTST